MLVLALPAKSFQLYFNFIQSATSPFFLPALSRIFVQMAADGRKKEHTSLLSIIRVELRDDEGERERDHARLSISPQQRRLFHSARNRGKFMMSPCTLRVSRS